MVKLAILGLVVYLGWKAWEAMRAGPAERRREQGPVSRLVRDPQCNTYVPEHSAERVREGDEVIYFCSPECREAYLKSKRGESA